MPLSFNPNTPQASSTVASTQNPILVNFQSIDTSFNDSSNGNFTKVIFQNVGTPAGGAPVNPVSIIHAANDAASNPALFFRNSIADAQISGPFISAANGSTTLCGGIVLKWGVGTCNNPAIVNSFASAFPTNCFAVVVTSTDTAYTRTIVASTFTTTGFSALRKNGVGVTGFTYIAMGN